MDKMSLVVAGPLQNNVWFIRCDSGRLYIIDPAFDPEKLLAEAAKYNFTEAVILLTHAHADHIGALKQVAAALKVRHVMLDESDEEMYRSAYNAIVPFLPAQEDLPQTEAPQDCGDFKVLHTPGHTPGGVCYYFPGLPGLFSGDTLFYESVGRSDLPGGNGKLLIDSIRHAILSIADDELAVYPGHGPATTVGHERRCNPYL